MSLLCLALRAGGQTTAPPAPKSQEEIKAELAHAYNQNALGSLAGPYHLVATFQTFTLDGQPAGEGSVERFFVSVDRQKTITHFRDHTMTEYVYGGKRQYTDDGFDGTIMVYRVWEFLFRPLSAPSGMEKRTFNYTQMELSGVPMDCAKYDFYLSEGPNKPAPLQEVLCVSQTSHDLILKQTQHLSIRYKDFLPFEEKSIPRTASVTGGAEVRGRIHIDTLERTSVADADLMPPPDSSPSTPGPEWFGIHGEEDKPTHQVLFIAPRDSHGATGVIAMMVLASRTGAVKDVEPLYAPSPALMEPAMRALRQWTYKPLIRNGRAVETIRTIDINVVNMKH